MVLYDSVGNHERAYATLGNLLNPPPLDPNVAHVAHLYPTGTAVAEALQEAGARIAYAYIPGRDERTLYAHAAYDAVADTPPFAGRVRDSVRLAPRFNVIVVHNNPRPRRPGRQRISPMEHALRFLRARDLAALVVLGPAPAPGETEEAERLGYPLVAVGGALVGLRAPGDGPLAELVLALARAAARAG